MTKVGRLVPDIPFPVYAFVPGQNPHPLSDPAGHSFGHEPNPVEPLEPKRWRDCLSYLFAMDLFNHGFYWEAHEAWEGLWHACGRTGPTGDFLKALIKLAAAGVKQREGRPKGVKSHSVRAAELLRAVAGQVESGSDCFLGLSLTELIEVAEGIGQNGWPEAAPVLWPASSLK